MKKNLSKLLLFSSSLFVAAALSAQVTIVHWQGDYVSGNTNLARGNTSASNTLDFFGNSGRHAYKAWNETTPLSPSYTVPSERSGTFYGAMLSSYTATDPTVFLGATNRISDFGALDRIDYRHQVSSLPGGMTGRNGAFLIGFLSNDFLAGGSNPYGFDATSSMSVNMTVFSAGFTGRFMVKQDDTWYVSNLTFTGGGTKTLAGQDLVDATWASFNPATDILLSNPVTFQQIAWTDVQGVGFYSNFSLGSGTGVVDANFNEFLVEATVIPEPRTYAAIFGLMAFGFILWRRRR